MTDETASPKVESAQGSGDSPLAAEPLHICIDCKWCASSNSIPLCKAPQAPRSLVDGKHFLSCHTHRDPAGLQTSYPERYCGPSGHWFEPKTKPKEYME